MTSPFASSGSQSAPSRTSGRISELKFPAELSVATGFYDDDRQPIPSAPAGPTGATRPGPLFGIALHAWRYQDTWSEAEHESFWAAVLPLWPYRPGHRATRRTLGTWAAHMHRRGLSEADIAEVLGYPPETLSRYRAIEVGEMLLREREEMAQTLRPTVYADFEDEPLGGRLNLPIEPWFTPRDLQDGFALARAAQGGLRQAQTRRRVLLASLQHVE